uniref:Uncharacterized protein n=1 Tax=Vespula pensylvanica TaxID=30213 RepID=A0A834K104_VESPE|nr:hypothetical protein H0235_016144 [Vespula pensylvanica]
MQRRTQEEDFSSGRKLFPEEHIARDEEEKEEEEEEKKEKKKKKKKKKTIQETRRGGHAIREHVGTLSWLHCSKCSGKCRESKNGRRRSRNPFRMCSVLIDFDDDDDDDDDEDEDIDGDDEDNVMISTES